jgi:UDP-3-O-[3-hydroxymyristoyl] glucosamine N-acyltransferase
MNVYNLQDLAQALNGQAVGDVALPVTGACEPQDAAGSLLAIATTQSYVERLALGQARIALLAKAQIGKVSTFWVRFSCRGPVLPWRVCRKRLIIGGGRARPEFIRRPVWNQGR